ncbi:MAG TPA: hypothetical protein VF062_27685 [Candidatus Limnocylindrales bacterium]
MSAQVNHDLLADYVGGALDGSPEFERVAGLVATDPEWRRAADKLSGALEAVDRDLSVLRDTPEPMPDDVSARLEQLFASPGRDPLAPRVVDVDRARRRVRSSRWKRWAAPVAIAAAALAFFGIGKLPSAVNPAMPDGAGSGDARLNAEAPTAAQGIPSPVPTTVTWFDYNRETVKSMPPAASLPQFSTESDTARSTDKAPGALLRLSDPLALNQCLATVTSVLPGRVDGVEYAAFEGSPALVITITGLSGRWRFVAGPACGQQGPDERFRTPLE